MDRSNNISLPRRLYLAIRVFFESIYLTVKFRNIPYKCATVFGSARTSCPEKTLEIGYAVGQTLAHNGWAVMTGGGPGVMASVNRGCIESGGISIGCNIHLPTEQSPNQHVTHNATCKFFVNRKRVLIANARCFIALPGGYGTLDELFEVITLITTKQINPIPVIMIDKIFWEPVLAYVDTMLCETYKTVDKRNGLIQVIDDVDELAKILQKL